MTAAAPSPSPRAPRFSPRWALCLGTAAVSTGSIFIRLADAPVVVVALWRTGLATLLLLPFALRGARAELARASPRERWAGVGAGLFLALHFVTWTASLAHTSVAASTVIVCTVPIWVALAGPFVTGEPLRRATLAGIGLAVAGAAWIGGAGGGESALAGNLLALAGALLAALYVLLGRILRRRVSLATSLLAMYGTAAGVLALHAAASGAAVFGHSAATYAWLCALALVPQMIGHTSYNYALRYERASLVSVAMLGEPVGATLLAWACLGERPGAGTLLGGAAILAGIALVARAEDAPAPRPAGSAEA